MFPRHHPRQNHILAALQEETCARLYPHLELVEMPLGEVLHESGSQMLHVYFPTTAIVSRLYVTESGASSQIAVIGNEGIIGVSLFMGGESTPSRAIVQSAGHGYRLQRHLLTREFDRGGELQHRLLRYTQALMTLIGQTAVCNRHHKVEQQLCRWLLQTLDRLSSSELVITHEMIANMLGVRREGVTEAACELHERGLIEYRRGHISVLDRAGLEQRVCECYSVVKREFDRLVPDLIHPISVANRIHARSSYQSLPRRSLNPVANARC